MAGSREYKRLNTRRASVVRVGGFRPTGDPLATHFGMQPVGAAGEIWPEFEGRPLLFVCQLNLAAAPVVPTPLEGIQLVTFFCEAGLSPNSKENGFDWRLFAYHSLDGLVPLARPAHAPKLRRGAECQWEVCDDHPDHDDSERQAVEGFDDSDIELDNVARTKIGGYASSVQSEPWWGYSEHPANPAFCLQIAGEEKAGVAWGDAGIVHLARGTADGYTDQWFLDRQSY